MRNDLIVVMIVEEEQVLLDALCKKVELNQVKPLSFNRGVPALAYLSSSNLDRIIPNIIWLDYNLPDIDGGAFLEELTKYGELAEIPVVVVSNSYEPEKIERVMKLGAKECFLKVEHSLDDLVDTISKYVS
ncbi:hypothetical protein A3K34_03700 [candidate division WWE3 bacterium RIFOXYC1_FULL_40_10]|uniref:Response regulatory domain-containing protein n=1 Tax=candidate division WWE3 bacterium RIFOXYA2_FULL_46_9 TaxID=1802636 RepID=A0A1F4W2X8_UNCKA|nr:MAG: hypothetical protein A3K58_03700 [candidate division WWE3 bacterium RIFOXYB1_FULL_40_22]OGC61946.1 MAG: hypothetical protein A3K37_03700 [candidate division WWE3 bacterium RIFOXYA1_FULL_40_11]OGC63772.1 MAG: hypothetical protein A2264_02645 [candidate division WWE3 bacterium RIFOXYA2_FULL_46_9]OGC64503.1 MAG: hypothetical protein A2326_03840 [candidate division WWE3 bacterium RIFOXYB2_FULL_41_6]OGC66329.1 MAG: hypothetical protein A3K34_03700 [candidate division WWE3 bacterium RIFOXYC1_